MTQIDVGDGEEARNGLVALVITVVELLLEALEREAVRRMESGDLTDGEIDRLGRQLATIEAEIEQLNQDEGIEDGVADLRNDLDDLVGNALEQLEDQQMKRKPGYSVFGGEQS